MKTLSTLWIGLWFIFGNTTTSQAQLSVTDFTLRGTDGRKHRLSEYDGPALVVVFFSHNCMYCQRYEARLMALADHFAPAGVPVLLVNPNNPKQNPFEGMDEMRHYVAESGLTLPYLQDPDGTVAKLFGATRTPESYLLGRSEDVWQLLYHGPIDNSPLNASDVTQAKLHAAVERVLNGDLRFQNLDSPDGCKIQP